MKNQQLKHGVAYPVLGRRTRLFLWGLTAQAREIRPRKNPTIPKLIPCQHAQGLPQRQALGGGLHKNPWFAYCSFQVSRCWRRRMLIPVAHSHVDRPAHGRAFAAVALRDIFKCFRLLLFSTLLPRTAYNKHVFLDMKAPSCVLGGGWGIF